MTYAFKTDDKGKSFEMKLDDETILTAFVTEDADSELPEITDGYYGGIGPGVMSKEWAPAGGSSTGGTVFVHPSLNEEEAYELDLTWNEINTALENGSMVYLEVTTSVDENFTRVYSALATIGRVPTGYIVEFQGVGSYSSDTPDGVLAEVK